MTQPGEGARRSEGDLLSLREITQRVLRHWLSMATVGGAVFLSVAIWTLVAAPRYESTAVLRIMDQQNQMGLPDALGSLPGMDLMGFSRDELETEVGVLRSWRIAGSVVDSLGLTVRVTRPKGIRRQILRVERLGDPDRQARIDLERSPDGSYSVRVKEPDEPRRLLDSLAPGEQLEWAGYTVSLADTLGGGEVSKIRIEIVPWYEAVDDLRDDLDISRQEGGSRLVEVSYELPDREMSAHVVNALVREYVAYKRAADRADSRFTVGELRIQVAEEAQRLADAEERLRSYQEDNLIVAPEEEATQQVRRLAQLQLAEDVLQVERTALADLLEIIDDRASATNGDRGQAYRQLATFPSLISNGAIQELLVALLELENQESELLARRTADNSDVRQLSERIAEVEAQLHRLGNDYLESLSQQMASTAVAMDELNTLLAILPEREMEYLRLFRERTMLTESFLLLEQQLKIAEVDDAIRSEGVRIVDEGLVAHEDDPAFPKPGVMLFLGLVLALASGVLTAVLRDLWEG